ncbi:MAG: GNAT family N-acetyltransferase [Bacteroidetes bacterium]|nr:GNAT family N-acetyltransferase [Bacteroidota bacterium]
MIDFQELTPSDKLILKKIKKIYENSFPPDERRLFKKVVNLLNDTRFSLSAIKFENEVVGMLSLWDFTSFVYIEHFAISEEFRNNGLGSYVLKKLIQDENRQIVLEVELPEDVFSLKRIKFYERFGFYICRESYIQPPYDDRGKEALPMLIMAKPEIDSSFIFEDIRKTIHQKVYFFFE